MNRQSLVRGRAFALVDVIAATVLIGVALAAAIALIGRAMTAQRLGEQIQTAAMLADEQLSLVLARGPDEYERRFATDGHCDPPFERFSYAVDVSGGSTSHPYTVTATISWSSGRDKQSVVVQTLMASRLGDDQDPDRRPQTPVERYQ